MQRNLPTDQRPAHFESDDKPKASDQTQDEAVRLRNFHGEFDICRGAADLKTRYIQTRHVLDFYQNSFTSLASRAELLGPTIFSLGAGHECGELTEQDLLVQISRFLSAFPQDNINGLVIALLLHKSLQRRIWRPTEGTFGGTYIDDMAEMLGIPWPWVYYTINWT
ncbi:uncharacterized protein K489DRAFT_374935 [Dissoconium aciculare CBS 342.82]|uniref:Uncharacterized protein n=1 Tax=Dissoconium aciculare CBS 342.82 TaxID=1314786 RepID=A0A6J3MG64_9PEZI|nr:uncharacterized protein K489DRAFT_374935 [Dissoconium aciculare CBS 342.82]KAF1826853.1 hypothetical protein K489DRAFT_374935 [Dissoconium aciculare CBS 342.82]